MEMCIIVNKYKKYKYKKKLMTNSNYLFFI